MITVTIYKNQEDEYVGFQCKGHAGYGPHGKDIVCASVSVLIINTINSIEAFTYDKCKVDTDEEEGLIECIFHSEPSAEAALLLDSMVLGLQEIEKKYEDEYLKLIVKEV